jgi:hypothetical protein
MRGFFVELFLLLLLVWLLEKRICALEDTEVHNEEERRLETLREEEDTVDDNFRRMLDDPMGMEVCLLVGSRSTEAEGVFESLRRIEDMLGAMTVRHHKQKFGL